MSKSPDYRTDTIKTSERAVHICHITDYDTCFGMVHTLRLLHHRDRALVELQRFFEFGVVLVKKR